MPEVKNKKLILVDYIVSIVIVIAIITYFIVSLVSLNNWKNAYHELELSYSEELLEAEIYVEAIEEFAYYEIEIAELQAELKYLKEHVNLIIDKEIAQEEQYWQEQYLETMFKLVSDIETIKNAQFGIGTIMQRYNNNGTYYYMVKVDNDTAVISSRDLFSVDETVIVCKVENALFLIDIS